MARSKRAEIEKAANAAGADRSGEQLALLAPVAAVEDALGSDAGAELRRGRGRPPGARNRRTAEMLEYLEALGLEPPMLALAKRAATDTRQLATALRCSIKDAYDSQQSALAALLPYWHQKLPMAVDLQGAAPVPLILGFTLGEGGEDGAVAAGGSVFDLLGDVEVNQGVSEVVEGTVGQEPSDDEG